MEYFTDQPRLSSQPQNLVKALNRLKNNYISAQKRKKDLKIFTLWNILPALLIFQTAAPNLRAVGEELFYL